MLRKILILLISASLVLGIAFFVRPKQVETPEVEETVISEGTLEERLLATGRVKDIERIGSSDDFSEVYLFRFEQYIDHENKDLGTFSQKVELGFNGYDLANVLVTSGYETSDDHSEFTIYSENELAFLLGCNYVFVEHRYFGDSMPLKPDYDDTEYWRYLDTRQAASDHHEIVRELKRILDGKWCATGTSKGGISTELYAYYYPGEMDLYLPYVAPFPETDADTKYIPFLNEEIGDIQYGRQEAARLRKVMLDFQLKLLEYRDDLAPRYFAAGLADGGECSKHADADIVYDMTVIDFAFAFWMYYQRFDVLEQYLAMPERNDTELAAKRDAFLEALLEFCPPNFTLNGSMTPYYIQAYQELGSPGYDFSYLREAYGDPDIISISAEDDGKMYWDAIFNDAELELEQHEPFYERINEMLRTTDDHFIIIYGSSDPYYSLRPKDVHDRDNISIYVNDNRPHSAKISNFDEDVKEEMLAKIRGILE